MYQRQLRQALAINLQGRGYTLIELLVAMAAGLFLLSGVAMSYTAIKSTVVASKELSHAQEVIRYTSQVMTRSIKQTYQKPELENNKAALRVHQKALQLACDGSVPTVDYSELFTLSNGYLTCDIGSGPVQLLRGVEALSFDEDGILISIIVKPVDMPKQFENGVLNDNGVQIDIAANRLVLDKAVFTNP